MVIVLRKIHCQPEKTVELTQSLSTIMAQIRRLDGCMECRLYKDNANDLSFLWVEKWESQTQREHHIGSDHFSILLGAISVLCERSEAEILMVSHSETMNRECDCLN